MKKQILRLVLAFSLIFGYTLNAVAVPEVTSSGSQGLENLLKDARQSSSISVLSNEETNKILLIGKISSVLNYKNGQLVAMRNRDGSIDVYDNGGFRASMKKMDDESGYTYTRFQINSSDLESIDAAGGIENWAKALGFSDNDAGLMKRLDTGDDATSTSSTIKNLFAVGYSSSTDSNGRKDWNSISLTISLAGESSEITISEDGRSTKALDISGRLSGEWIYGANGELKQMVRYIAGTIVGEDVQSSTTATKEKEEINYKRSVGEDLQSSTTATSVTTKSFEPPVVRESNTTATTKSFEPPVVKESNTTATSVEKVAALEAGNGRSHVYVTEYKNGKEVSTWKADLSTGTSVDRAIGNVDMKTKQDVSTYAYNKDGSKQSEHDLKDGTTTFYGNGKPIYTTNREGAKTASYSYSSAGLLQSVVKYVNGAVTDISVYSDDGRFLGSGEYTNEKALRDALRNLDTVIHNNSNQATNSTLYAQEVKEAFLSAHITSFNFSVKDLQNETLVRILFLNEEEEGEVQRYLNKNSGKTLLEALDALSTGASSNELKDRFKSIYDGVTALIRDGHDFQPKLSLSAPVTREEIKPETAVVNSATDQRSEGVVEGRSHVADTNHGKGWDRGGGLGSTDTFTYNDLFTQESNQGLYRATVNVTADYNVYTDHSVTFSITLPIDRNGAAPVLTNTRVLKTDKKVESQTKDIDMYYDPAVIGKAEAYTDADGNIIDVDIARKMIGKGDICVFIKMSPTSINMFDGAGFQDINPKEGEEIFVKVEDMNMFDAFAGSVGTDSPVMVTGVVTNDINGKLTMQVYNSTSDAGKAAGFNLDSTDGKGYSVGDQLNAMKDEIDKLEKQEGSWVARNVQTNQSIFAQAGLTNSSGYLNDWKSGWNELARLAGGQNRK
jgi:hypothetical protein